MMIEKTIKSNPPTRCRPAILLVMAGCGFFLMKPSAFASAGTQGASFLEIPVGAGPAAMGGAYTALAANAYAPTWNPAGLGRLSGTEMAAQHLSYLESMNYEFLSMVHPFGGQESATKRGIGFSVQYLGSGEINHTDIDASGVPINNGNALGTFSSHFASYNMSYGQTLTPRMAVGLTAKWINAEINDVSANAYAADVAALYHASDHVELGASLVNMGTSLKFISAGENLPMAFKAGGALRIDSHYVLSAEGVYEKNDLASFHMGAEWRPLEMVSVRAGYRTDTLKGLSPLAGFSTGCGLHLWGQEFAYAWTPYGDLGDTQYFSLLIHFGSANEIRQNLIQYQRIKSPRTVRQGAPGSDPEYQQLMQLMSAEDTHTAKAGPSKNPSEQ